MSMISNGDSSFHHQRNNHNVREGRRISNVRSGQAIGGLVAAWESRSTVTSVDEGEKETPRISAGREYPNWEEYREKAQFYAPHGDVRSKGSQEFLSGEFDSNEDRDENDTVSDFHTGSSDHGSEARLYFLNLHKTYKSNDSMDSQKENDQRELPVPLQQTSPYEAQTSAQSTRATPSVLSPRNCADDQPDFKDVLRRTTISRNPQPFESSDQDREKAQEPPATLGSYRNSISNNRSRSGIPHGQSPAAANGLARRSFGGMEELPKVEHGLPRPRSKSAPRHYQSMIRSAPSPGNRIRGSPSHRLPSSSASSIQYPNSSYSFEEKTELKSMGSLIDQCDSGSSTNSESNDEERYDIEPRPSQDPGSHPLKRDSRRLESLDPKKSDDHDERYSRAESAIMKLTRRSVNRSFSLESPCSIDNGVDPLSNSRRSTSDSPRIFQHPLLSKSSSQQESHSSVNEPRNTKSRISQEPEDLRPEVPSLYPHRRRPSLSNSASAMSTASYLSLSITKSQESRHGSSEKGSFGKSDRSKSRMSTGSYQYHLTKKSQETPDDVSISEKGSSEISDRLKSMLSKHRQSAANLHDLLRKNTPQKRNGLSGLVGGDERRLSREPSEVGSGSRSSKEPSEVGISDRFRFLKSASMRVSQQDFSRKSAEASPGVQQVNENGKLRNSQNLSNRTGRGNEPNLSTRQSRRFKTEADPSGNVEVSIARQTSKDVPSQPSMASPPEAAEPPEMNKSEPPAPPEMNNSEPQAPLEMNKSEPQAPPEMIKSEPPEINKSKPPEMNISSASWMCAYPQLGLRIEEDHSARKRRVEDEQDYGMKKSRVKDGVDPIGSNDVLDQSKLTVGNKITPSSESQAAKRRASQTFNRGKSDATSQHTPQNRTTIRWSTGGDYGRKVNSLYQASNEMEKKSGDAQHTCSRNSVVQSVNSTPRLNTMENYHVVDGSNVTGTPLSTDSELKKKNDFDSLLDCDDNTEADTTISIVPDDTSTLAVAPPKSSIFGSTNERDVSLKTSTSRSSAVEEENEGGKRAIRIGLRKPSGNNQARINPPTGGALFHSSEKYALKSNSSADSLSINSHSTTKMGNISNNGVKKIKEDGKDGILSNKARSRESLESGITKGKRGDKREEEEWDAQQKFSRTIIIPAVSNGSFGVITNGYTVWCSFGNELPTVEYQRWVPPTKGFDATYKTLKEANNRAYYLFYWKNPMGVEPNMLAAKCGEVEEAVTKKCKSYQCTESGHGKTWKVAVVPSEVFEWLDRASKRRHHFDDEESKASTPKRLGESRHTINKTKTQGLSGKASTKASKTQREEPNDSTDAATTMYSKTTNMLTKSRLNRYAASIQR